MYVLRFEGAAFITSTVTHSKISVEKDEFLAQTKWHINDVFVLVSPPDGGKRKKKPFRIPEPVLLTESYF